MRGWRSPSRGKSAGGFTVRGLPRCAMQSRIAGRNAAAETIKGYIVETSGLRIQFLG